MHYKMVGAGAIEMSWNALNIGIVWYKIYGMHGHQNTCGVHAWSFPHYDAKIF
jgi:hypothetical protein